MPLTKQDAAWNTEALQKVRPILKTKNWLISLKNYDLSWEDEARIDRATSLLDLAT
jgi:hypothetical protein